MHRDLGSTRLVLLIIVSTLATALALATLLWPAWIETVFRIDPDAGDGSLETAITQWAVAIALIVDLAACLDLALTRRTRAA